MSKYQKVEIKNNFYYRYPYFSYDFYEENLLHNDKNIQILSKQKYGEHIAASSKQLYDMMQQNINSKNKTKSLYKYLLRGSVRTTPYGINAGIGQGFFSENSIMKLAKENKKKVRPDMEWLCKVIKLCEKELQEELKVIKGENFYIQGLKLIKHYDSCYVRDRNRNVLIESKINNTDLVQLIFSLCENKYTSISDIMNELVKKYGEDKRDRLLFVITDLIENEYINSNLKVSLLSKNIFKNLLNNLKEYNKECNIFRELNDLDNMLLNYETMKIGESEKEYLEILRKMKVICEADNYLQIDMYNNSKISLNKSMKKDIEDFANFFISWCISETYDDYINKFREKYGEQAIRVVDVLNPDTGLGYPVVDNRNTTTYIEWWLTILLNFIIRNRKKKSIDLSEIKDDFPFQFNNNELKFPITFELSFYIIKYSDRYEYIISPMLGSEEKWKSYGRFDYLFEENLIDEDKLYNTAGFKEVELTFYPVKSHDANVSICFSNKPAYMELNTTTYIDEKERVSINDVYMYIDKNSRISFSQGKTDEILSFSTTNKYITGAFPQPLKAIVEISKNQRPSFEIFFYALGKILNNLSGHIPEIRYKNIIITQETWKIPNENLMDNGKLIDFNSFKQVISSKVLNSELPINISTGPIDRKLILNLKNDMNLEILFDMLKTTPNLLINKNSFNNNSLMLNDSESRKYICEFVFQFEQVFTPNNDLKYSSKRIPQIDQKYIDCNKNYPFDKWISMNLYINEELENKLLINQVKQLYINLKSKNYIDKFFFIRYKDPKNHLRIRFKINEEYQKETIKEINLLISILKNNSLLNDVSYTTYEPEINRYGGVKCIELAESVFNENSLVIIELLNMLNKKTINLNIEYLFLIGTYKMIYDMGIGDEEFLEYIRRYKLDKKYNKLYIEMNNNLSDFFSQKDINSIFREKSDLINLLITFDKGTIAYQTYWSVVNQKYYERNFDNFIVRRYCINSVIHMYFNRLLGIHRERENILMGILEKIIYTKIQKEKKYGG
jgi:thiopeptide-type bacteriocin biosynthesis protein